VLVLTAQLTRTGLPALPADQIAGHARLGKDETRRSLQRLIRRGLIQRTTMLPDGARVRTVYGPTADGIAVVEETCLCSHRRSGHAWSRLRTGCRDCDCAAFNAGTWADMFTSPARAILTRGSRGLRTVSEASHRGR
jgi:hypothetical protein